MPVHVQIGRQISSRPFPSLQLFLLVKAAWIVRQICVLACDLVQACLKLGKSRLHVT